MNLPNVVLLGILCTLVVCNLSQNLKPTGTSAGWEKYAKNPVLSGYPSSTFFDVSTVNASGKIMMWFSWRTPGTIGFVESTDGINWSQPLTVLSPGTDWETSVNRPGVVLVDGTYHMWYTGQNSGKSAIGYARSVDGIHWTKVSANPVLSATVGWEKVAVMCPDVLYDKSNGIFKMYYSGGEQYEPDAIGYATSKDGVTWQKYPNNPIFAANPSNKWEQDKVTACAVQQTQDGYFSMFYIGFQNISFAQIGIARSRDGLSNWERHPQNPVISPGPEHWDDEATYKPSPLWIPGFGSWYLWYNGRSGSVEEIGLAVHKGYDLWTTPTQHP